MMMDSSKSNIGLGLGTSFSFTSILVSLLLLLLLVLKQRSRKLRLNLMADATNDLVLPPGPPRLPVIGNLHQLLGNKNPHRSLHELSQTYGPVMQLQLGQIPAVVVSSKAAVEELAKAHDASVADRPALLAADHLLYGRTDVAYAPYGPYWRQARRICVLELLAAAKVRSFGVHREAEVSQLVTRIIDCSEGGAAVNLSELLALYANGVLCRSAFGKLFLDHEFHKLVDEFFDLLAGFKVGEFFPSWEWLSVVTGYKRRLVKNHTSFDQFFDSLIRDKRNRKIADDDDDDGEVIIRDFVDVLLDVQRHGKLDMIPLTTDNIKAIIMIMLAAGSDTSYVTLEWSMAELIRHPNIMKKAQQEVRHIVGDRLSVSEDDLSHMKFLKQIIKEVFRLHPAAPFVQRKSREEICLGGYTITPETWVFINIWANGRDKELWRDAEVFDPERFCGSSLDIKGHDYELLPFGFGRRICPGMMYAMAEVELALAQLLHTFDWELPPGMKIENLDMSEKFGLVMPLASPLKLIAKPHHT